MSWLALAVWVIGLAVFALCSNPKAQELGRICFGVGLLVFLLLYWKILTVLRW